MAVERNAVCDNCEAKAPMNGDGFPYGWAFFTIILSKEAQQLLCPTCVTAVRSALAPRRVSRGPQMVKAGAIEP